MDVEKLVDDVLLFRRKELTFKERDQIIDEILRIEDLMGKYGIFTEFKDKNHPNDETLEIIHRIGDRELVSILDQDHTLYAFMFFDKVGNRLNTGFEHILFT